MIDLTQWQVGSDGYEMLVAAFEKMRKEWEEEQPRSKRIETKDIGKAVNKLNKRKRVL